MVLVHRKYTCQRVSVKSLLIILPKRLLIESRKCQESESFGEGMSSPQTKIFIFHWKTNAVSRHTSRFSTFGEFCCVHQITPLCHALLKTQLNSHTPRFRKIQLPFITYSLVKRLPSSLYPLPTPPFPSLSLLLFLSAIWLPFLSLPPFILLPWPKCPHISPVGSVWTRQSLSEYLA